MVFPHFRFFYEHFFDNLLHIYLTMLLLYPLLLSSMSRELASNSLSFHLVFR